MPVPKVILLIETSRAYGRGLLLGIAEYSRLHGPWSFQKKPYRYTCGGRRATREVLRRLKRSDADGIIGHAIDARSMSRIIQAGIPVVAQGVPENVPRSVNIICDDKAIGEIAAAHLLDRGFRNFAYCGFDYMSWSQRRNRSFVARIVQAGFTVHTYRQSGSAKQSWTAEQDNIADWLKSLPKPVGLMACNDDRSENVAEACKLAGLAVPEQVAIIGVDNDEFVCALSDPPLSSVALNCEKAGYEVARMLDALMKGERIRQKTVLIRPTHVAVRRSTEILAIEDSVVARAVRFICENCTRPIQVSDVVSAVALSRRNLEGRFRRVMRCSIYDQIRRHRVAQVARMLVETKMPVSEIADTLNFPGASHIARLFREEMRISPSAYRKQHSL